MSTPNTKPLATIDLLTFSEGSLEFVAKLCHFAQEYLDEKYKVSTGYVKNTPAGYQLVAEIYEYKDDDDDVQDPIT